MSHPKWHPKVKKKPYRDSEDEIKCNLPPTAEDITGVPLYDSEKKSTTERKRTK